MSSNIEPTIVEPTISELPDPAEAKLQLTAGPLAFNLHGLDLSTIISEFNSLRQSVTTMISDGPSSGAAFLPVVNSIHSGELDLTEIATAWQHLSKMDAHAGISSTESQVLTALSLASHSTMWAWFNKNVTEPTRWLAMIPVSVLNKMEPPKLENEWIFPLFQSIQLSLLLRHDIKLPAKEFFPDLNAPDYEACCKNGPTAPRILSHVESAVVLWLRFYSRPEMGLETSRAVATFISTTRKAFGSIDFLYLRSVQNGIKRLRSILTTEGISLTKVPWEKLANELSSHPLADPTSNEAILLNRMQNLLWTVSSLPHTSTEMTSRYWEAVKMGSDGVDAFAQWLGQPSIA